jgi:hypothetical protein
VRVEPWLQAGKYVSAVAGGGANRNGWTIAEQAGDRTPGRTQRLLYRAVWDTVAAMGVVRRFAVTGLDERPGGGGGPAAGAAGALDETSQQKQGTATAGVKRHYLGCVRKVANGITTVHRAYVREKTGHALIGARQWIPAGHLGDPVKSLAMGLPGDLVFRTKGQLAIDIAPMRSLTASPSASCAATRSTATAPNCGSSAKNAGRESRLIRAAGLRWPVVEEGFEFGKGCFGLDQSQVRLYTAIARHTVLVMAALAAYAVTAASLRGRTDTQRRRQCGPISGLPLTRG